MRRPAYNHKLYLCVSVLAFGTFMLSAGVMKRRGAERDHR
jgi:hypothetical protein